MSMDLCCGANGHGRTASTHTLPTEILSFIFELVTHGPSRDERGVIGDGQRKLPFNPNSVTSPLTLCAVNRRWRSIGLTTPTLWTSIIVSIDNIVTLSQYSSEDSLLDYPGFSCRDSVLDVESLARFIVRSRTCPIDILIDGRDPEWEFPDFSDPLHLSGSSARQHPFHPHFMTLTLDILLHHVTRWRSLTILTDTWAPMHAAVTRLSRPPGPAPSNPFPGDARGAACLETLTLMHCNEYIGQADGFNIDEQGYDDPKEAIHTPFAALFGCTRDATHGHLNCYRHREYNQQGAAAAPTMTRLRSLSLLGVHVDWAAVASLVGDTWTCTRGLSGGSIQMLELSYLGRRVRPRVADFFRMLQGCRNLRSLSLKRSGLLHEGGEDESAFEGGSIDLPSLEKIHLAYDAVLDATQILTLLHCPNLKLLELEQIISPDSITPEDASVLLEYCSTGSFSKPADLDTAVKRQKQRRPHFAVLEDLTLHHVTARDAGSYAVLFGCLPNLRRLALCHTPVCAIASLLPRQVFCDGEDGGDGDGDGPEGRVCTPCVRLERLEVTHVDVRAYHVLGYTLKERGKRGCSPVREVKFCLEVGDGGCLSSQPVRVGNSTYEEITHVEVVHT